MVEVESCTKTMIKKFSVCTSYGHKSFRSLCKKIYSAGYLLILDYVFLQWVPMTLSFTSVLIPVQ